MPPCAATILKNESTIAKCVGGEDDQSSSRRLDRNRARPKVCDWGAPVQRDLVPEGGQVSGRGELEDRQVARWMHRGHVETGSHGECSEFGNAAFSAAEVGEHPQVHVGAR